MKPLYTAFCQKRYFLKITWLTFGKLLFSFGSEEIFHRFGCAAS
jgi:hypothetical protein